MDMDDDFMGEIEFDLNAPQKEIVTQAIDLASKQGNPDTFAGLNPLIAIMQWWESHSAANDVALGSPEDKLAAICEEFVRVQESEDRS